MAPFVIEVHDHQRFGEAVMVRAGGFSGSTTVFRCKYVQLDGTQCTWSWTSDVSLMTGGQYVMLADSVRAALRADVERMRAAIARALAEYDEAPGSLSEKTRAELANAVGRT